MYNNSPNGRAQLTMRETIKADPTIAVLIPCYQEELTIGKVVEDFRRVLPAARIYVYDNNCTDATVANAKKAGAIVRREKRQGKGFVVASMFDQVKEDILVMVDGDDTYDASHVHKLLEPILRGDADMTVATRLTNYGEKSFRPLHVAGNRLVCGIINWMFQSQVTDIFPATAFSPRRLRCKFPLPLTDSTWKPNSRYRRFTAAWSSRIPAPYRARPEEVFPNRERGLMDFVSS